MGRISWVCASCAQHFTRRFTANRHSRNLHDGKGIIVRILDYMVGRINGQFLSQDPLAYRREKKKEKNQSLFGANHSNYHESKVIADSTNDIISLGSKTSRSLKNSSESNYPDLLSQPTCKADSKKDLSSDPFQEFNFLVNKYYSRQTASKILALAAYLVSHGNHDFFEKKLTFLQELDSGNCFDKLLADKPNLEKSYQYISDFTFLLPKQDKKDDDSLSAAAKKQAKEKLLKIEELLTPHCRPEFVQNVIKQLIEICNMTGSYDILDEALENHRNNVNRFYLRRAN